MVPYDKLLYMMVTFGISSKYGAFVTRLYSNVECRVKINDEIPSTLEKKLDSSKAVIVRYSSPTCTLMTSFIK